MGLMESQLGAMVDLQQLSVFEEPFYIVVLERAGKGTTVHMWRLVMASQPESHGMLSFFPSHLEASYTCVNIIISYFKNFYLKFQS